MPPIHLPHCDKWGDDQDIFPCSCGLADAEAAGPEAVAAWVAAHGDGFTDEERPR